MLKLKKGGGGGGGGGGRQDAQFTTGKVVISLRGNDFQKQDETSGGF